MNQKLCEKWGDVKFRHRLWNIFEIVCYVAIIAALGFCFLIFKWGHKVYLLIATI